ncbi:hypothetical protein GCK72_023039 [Caenorhabditis remanei]|uniref:Uncharacterized protein n=1 Tax=Caenorhabditis remanei TaxID=31234 RepID=A0A6A5FVK9_CAERE|nr:hypothetical protein GCK72_023039 [Caenorhabditis remanei]KAF1746582.1 hypothetical protein GCK72_023039 [Caenorhabditis remanei]
MTSENSSRLSLDAKVNLFKNQMKPILLSFLSPPLVSNCQQSRTTMSEFLKKFKDQEDSLKSKVGPIMIEYLADIIIMFIEQNETRLNYTGSPATAAFQKQWSDRMAVFRSTQQFHNAPLALQMLSDFTGKFKELSEKDQGCLWNFFNTQIVTLARLLIHEKESGRIKMSDHYYTELNKLGEKDQQNEKIIEELKAAMTTSNSSIADEKIRFCKLEQEKSNLWSQLSKTQSRFGMQREEIKKTKFKMSKLEEEVKRLSDLLDQKNKEMINLRHATECYKNELEENLEHVAKQAEQLKNENQALKDTMASLNIIKKTTSESNQTEVQEPKNHMADNLCIIKQARDQIEKKTNEIFVAYDKFEETGTVTRKNEQITNRVQVFTNKKHNSNNLSNNIHQFKGPDSFNSKDNSICSQVYDDDNSEPPIKKFGKKSNR